MNCIRLIALIFFASFLISDAFSQTLDSPQIEGSASLAVGSNYVWRGQKLSPGTVTQPTVGVAYQGFNVNLWSNFSNDDSETTETDFTASYTFGSGILAFDIGYINYAFDGFKDTQEFYGGVTVDAFLSPSATFYYDFDEGEGAYLTAGLGHSLALSETVGLDIGLSASANFGNAIMGVAADGDTFSGLYAGEISAALSFPLFDAISLAPFAAFSTPLSDDAKAAIQAVSFDGDSDLFYGGLAISLSL